MSLSEQAHNRLQVVIDAIKEVSVESRETVLENLLLILLRFVKTDTLTIDVSDIQSQKEILEQLIGESNLDVVMQSLGFIENDGILTIDATVPVVIEKLVTIGMEFKNDLKPLDGTGETGEREKIATESATIRDKANNVGH